LLINESRGVGLLGEHMLVPEKLLLQILAYYFLNFPNILPEICFLTMCLGLPTGSRRSPPACTTLNDNRIYFLDHHLMITTQYHTMNMSPAQRVYPKQSVVKV